MFALLVGVMISCLVISIAWVFYKPLVGVLSLIMLAISVYFIVFFSISTSSDSSFVEEIGAGEDVLVGKAFSTDNVIPVGATV